MRIGTKRLEKQILRYFSQRDKFWYWEGADHFEPSSYEKEQERYGQTKYNMALERLEYAGLVRIVFVKGAANAEYYKITRKGKQELN